MSDKIAILGLGYVGLPLARLFATRYEVIGFDINQKRIDELKKGVKIGVKGGKYLTKPCKAKLVVDIPEFGARGRKIRDERHGPTSWASITVKEGKFRQVRKMTAAVGFPTLRLVRVRVGNVHLDNLQAGAVREVKYFDIEDNCSDKITNNPINE
mgnify:CR=1 FL=1